MFYINLGIAILLSWILPVTSVLMYFLRSTLSVLKDFNISNTVLGTVLMLISLGLLYLLAHFITKGQKFRERLPEKIPGKSLLMSGVVIYLLFKVALILASTIEGGGGVFTLRQLGVFVIYPAYILIGVGIYKASKSLAAKNP